MTLARRRTPKRSHEPGDRRPSADGVWKAQKRGTRDYVTWVSEARVAPPGKRRRAG